MLAALGGLFAERSGVVDIGLEGKMLAAAFAAAATAAVTGSAWLGLGGRHRRGRRCSPWCTASPAITYHGNQVVSGMALNIAVSGLTVGARLRLVPGGRPDAAPRRRRALRADRRCRAPSRWPACRSSGSCTREVVSGHNVLVYLAAVAVPAVAWLVYRTRFGLRLRAVGESPGAVDTAGISVAGTRYQALVVGGVLCGMAGAYLSIAHHASSSATCPRARAIWRSPR